MDFRLKVFKAVASNLSYTKAAKELGISQPAVTKHIQELENLYNVKLFERAGTSIVLTSKGSYLLEHTQTILSEFQAIEYDMQLISGEWSGELRIGATQPLMQYLLPSFVAGFMERFPNVKLHMVTASRGGVESALVDNRIDLGIVDGVVADNKICCEIFGDDSFIVVTNSKSNIQGKASGNDICKLPMILCHSSHNLSDALNASLEAQGKSIEELDVKVEPDSIEFAKKLLHNKVGYCSILPHISVAEELNVCKFKLIDIEPPFSIECQHCFITLHGKANALAEKFKSFLITGLNQK